MKLATAYIIILVSLFTYGHKHQQSNSRNVPEKAEAVVVQKEDARVEEVRAFFFRYNSPLASYAKEFVEEADRNGIDYKILPAIAGVESTFETNGNIYDHNPFGYMCESGPCYFDDYPSAIKRVAKTIGNGNAYARFQETGQIIELATVYNVVSPEDWTFKLKYFMERI